MDGESVSNYLRSVGLGAADTLAQRLVKVWTNSAGVPQQVALALGKTADPELCVNHLESLVASDSSAPRRLAALESKRLEGLFAVLGGSEHLAGLLLRGANWLDDFSTACSKAPASLFDVSRASTFGELQSLLRRQKARSLLSIGVRDLLGLSGLEETMRELSRLACAAVEAAYTWIRAHLASQYGGVTTGENGGEAAFVVMGMGKLGGSELNYSSDIDLVYIFESDNLESLGGERGKLTAREFFTRLAEGITRALSAITADGRVFRVDLRLRPDGVNGPVANSLAGAMFYYETWGQTWERSVLTRARPIAGSLDLGWSFLREISPFVYRRYLDFTTVEDMKEMKARIEASLREKGRVADVKLGRGGIREVEFVTHTLQLLHGGKDRELRTPSTMQAIGLLRDRGWLKTESADGLLRAYRFLRNVEHKIQLVDERQTQRVPSGKGEVALARRLGYHLDRDGNTTAELAGSALNRFRDDLQRHMTCVHQVFEAFFYSPAAEIRQGTDQDLSRLLDELEQEERVLWKLQQLGVRDTEAAYQELRLLRDGPPHARASRRRRKLLKELAPALLTEIATSPDPDQALRNIARFLGSAGARSTFLSLLLENPPTMRLLIRLFGASEYLSNFLIAHPELLDSLVRTDQARVAKERGELIEDMRREVGEAGSYEDKLNALRRFRNEEVLRIGLNEIDGGLDSEAVSAQLSDLAEICLTVATEVAQAEVLPRFGWEARAGELAIIGMGKLGSREITYNSDLDIIFVYSQECGRDESKGAHPHVVFTKVAQKIITTLQVPTREGIVYRIDTRLRPSGNSGPLVCSLRSFATYHEASSRIWERQALIKARVVVGERDLAARIEGIVSRFVYGRSLSAEEVKEIHRIRMRMERELAREKFGGFNIKTGRGGLVDIEFLTQMLQLRFGYRFPQLRVRSTERALKALAEVGVLPAAEAEELRDSYRFLRAIESSLRIEKDQAVEALDTDGDGAASLARRLGYRGEAAAAVAGLLADYQRHREVVRAHYGKWFELDSNG